MERICDIVLSSLALSILSPLFIPIVFILKLSGEGEVFFLQDRIGKNGNYFKLYKFATMLKNSPNIGTGTVTLKSDPRVLPVGKFLRKTKINELPQLLNIFFGHMSIIGPRPMTKQTFSSYSSGTQSQLILVKPGLSGIGSIVFRDEEEIMHGRNASLEFYNDIIAPYKGLLEEWFIVNKSMYVYFMSIFITAWAIIFPKSQLIWKVFKTMPKPPSILKSFLNYK